MHRSAFYHSPLRLGILWVLVGCLLAGIGFNRSAAAREIVDSAPQVCVQAPASLAAWLPLNGDVLEVWNSHTTTAIGSSPLVFVPGKIGQALQLTKTVAVQVADSPASELDPGSGNFSLAFWFKGSGVGYLPLLNKAGGNDTGYRVALIGGQLQIELQSTAIAVPSAPLDDDQWHFAVIRFDRAAPQPINVSVDTVALGSFAYSGPITDTIDTNVPLTLGAYDLEYPVYTAAIDEVDVYHSAISDQYVAQLYASVNGKCTREEAYRDIGAVRVWADSFVSSGGVLTASGNVAVGAASTNTPHFTLSSTVSWTPAASLGLAPTGVPLTANGILKMAGGGLSLGQGPFIIDADTGNVTWQPGSQVLYQTIGTSSLNITPSLSINVLQPGVTAQANLVLNLPEQNLNTNLQFTIGPSGLITGSTSSTLALTVAGGSLAGTVKVGEQGLYAPQINYSLPGIGTVVLQNLVIDGKGPLKMHFGANASFPIPNLNLGNNVFVLSNLQATLALTTTAGASTPSYALEMSGTLKLTGLPQNSGVQIPAFKLGIADGTVYGAIKNMNLNVAGKTMAIPDVAFRRQVFAASSLGPQAERYELVAGAATWAIPTPWQNAGQTSIALTDVTVSTEAPYIKIGAAGAGFSSSQTFYLGGSANSASSVSFKGLSGKFLYNAAQTTWTAQLSTTISLKFGQDNATTINSVQLTMNNGSISGTIPSVTLKVAGMNLGATNLAYLDDRFTAATATLTLPPAWGSASVNATSLVITKDSLNLGAAGVGFSSNQTYYLGGGATAAANVSFSNISGKFQYNTVQKVWTAQVGSTVSFKFGQDAAVTASNVQLTIGNNAISGTIASITLKAAGLNFTATNLAYLNDRFTAAAVTITLPQSWGVATVSATSLEITKDGFKLGAAGAGFSSNQTYYLGGSASSAASVSFSGLSGKFVFSPAQSAWTVQLGANISFKFGQDTAVTASNVQLTISNGAFSGSIANITLKVAGLNLKATNLAYANDRFTAATVTLTLPPAWGSISATVSGLEITRSGGLKLGGAGASFSLPNVNLGTVLQLSNMTGSFSLDAQNNYVVGIGATVKIQKVTGAGGSNGVSATGTLKIKNGQVEGTISQFSFSMVGLEFQVSNATMVNKMVTAQSVKLKLPPSLGSAQATIYGLEIGGAKGFAIAGGAFKLPNFTMAGVGVENAQAEFKEENGVYTIAAGAKINLKAMSIDGRFKLAYNSVNGQVQLKQVYIAFEGQVPTTAIPLGSTGFYITKIWGQFDMDTNLLKMSFGVRADTALKVGTTALLSIDGSVSIQVKPSFVFETSANAKLLGYDIASVNLKITSTSFALNAELHAGIIHAALEIAFGKDASNEFTFYGRATISLIIPTGAIYDGFWGTIPSSAWNIGELTFDAGKFYKGNAKVWGARFSGSFLSIGYYAFLQFRPTADLDVGTNMQAYVPIKPVLRSDELAALPANSTVFDVAISEPTTHMVFAEAITVANRIAPQDIQVISPQGVVFTQKLEFQ
jgi:hypothetical protein